MEPFEAAVYSTYFESGHRPERAPESTDRCFKRRWDQWLPADRNAKILDLGCGEAVWLSQLRSVFGYQNILGVDAAEALVKQARERAVPIIHRDLIGFFDTLSRDDLFDCISLFHVLEHLSPPAAYRVLTLVRDHLVPGGRCLIGVPNVLCPFSGMPFGDITHQTYFTLSSLSQLLWISGFESLMLIPDVVCGGSLRSRVRRRAAKWLLGIAQMEYGLVNGFTSARETTFEPEIMCMVRPRLD